MSHLEDRIQAATKAYRAEVAGWNENTVRTEAENLGIDGHETTPLVTLREEIVQHNRNAMRALAYPSAQLETNPANAGNPGNDAAALTA